LVEPAADYLLIERIGPFGRASAVPKTAVIVTSMSHVGKKSREATIFGFTSVVQIAKWLLHGFSLEAVFC
jgi:hypothetical protein